MAHFAPVAPIQVLEQLYEHEPRVFGEYHLLLAHHTVAYADRFRALFKRIAEDRIIDPIVIMDNSVVECGGYVNFDMMQSAVAAVRTDGDIQVVPVLPDVMGHGHKTREATLEAYSQWEREIPCVGFMAVCQGETQEDFQESVQLFANRARFPIVEYLGVPRYLVHLIGSRAMPVGYITEYVRRNNTFHKVHLLGYSDNMEDDLFCSHAQGIEGIDSAVPLRVQDKFDFNLSVGPRPEDWFDQAGLTPRMLANLGYARSMHGNL